MSIDYIRTTYGVPAKVGGRIRYTDSKGAVILGRITSADHRLRVRLDKRIPGYPMKIYLHPTWHVEYLESAL